MIAINQVNAGAQRREDQATLHLLALVALALVVRLALLPYATQESNDHTYRVFVAWLWAEHPTPFFHGLWGPLHYFLVGPVVRLFDDPVLAPVLLHIGAGSLVPAVLYLFTVREYGDRTSALAVGVAFALYPIAIRTSLQVMAQTWFYLCVALALLALSHARAPSGGRLHAAAAGLAATLGSLLRAEGWLMIPVLALTLWPRRTLVVTFLAVAMVGPSLMMVANSQHYGDPLFPLNQSTALMMKDVGAAGLSPAERIGQVMLLARGLVGGLTPVLALFAGLGALLCLIQRDRQAVWLAPLAVLGAFLFAGALRGSVTPKPIFTGTLGLLLIPYLAAFLGSPEVRRLGAGGTAGILALLFGSMASMLMLGVAREVPGVKERHGLVAAVPALSPVPTFPGVETLDAILTDIQPHRSSDALIVDALGNPAAFYLALHSRRYPDDIFLVPGQPYVDLEARLSDEERASGDAALPWDPNPSDLRGFLLRRCSGVLVLQPGSRFSDWLGYDTPDQISVRGVELLLHEQARAPWPMPSDARLRAAGTPAAGPGKVVVLRYSVENCLQPIFAAEQKRAANAR